MQTNQPQFQNYGTYPDQEDLEWKQANTTMEDDFSPEQQMRIGFIRKVFGILSAQLILSAFFIVLSCSVPSFAKFQIEYPSLIIISLIASFITIICLSCFESLRRTVPTNYILLSIFTLCEAYSVGFICTQYSNQVVLLAGLMTAAMTIGLTIYAFTTKKDFTTMGGVLFACLLGLILFGIACVFSRSRIINIIYCSCGVVLFGIYLIYDVQLLTGDKERSIDMDDYIYGAVVIYLDIINIFIYLLRILGKSNE